MLGTVMRQQGLAANTPKSHAEISFCFVYITPVFPRRFPLLCPSTRLSLQAVPRYTWVLLGSGRGQPRHWS